MTPEQFWYDDMRLIGAYEKAYYRNITYTAWINGNYTMIADEKAVRNAISTKPEHIDRNWVEYSDPIERLLKAKCQKDTKKEKKNQEEWFYNTFFA